jgi:hypothetical protein
MILCYRDSCTTGNAVTSFAAFDDASRIAALSKSIVVHVDLRSAKQSVADAIASGGGATGRAGDTVHGWNSVGWQLNAKGVAGPDVVSLRCMQSSRAGIDCADTNVHLLHASSSVCVSVCLRVAMSMWQ